MVPLNAGNVFGAEDGRPALAWESLIRGALRRAQPSKPKVRCYSHPASPSRFDPSAAAERLPGSDTEIDTDDDVPFSFPVLPEQYVVSTPRKMSRLNHFRVMDDSEHNHDELAELDQQQQSAQQRTLLRTLSRADRVGLVWPEQPLDLLAARTLNTASSLSSASFKESRSFSAYKSFKGSSTSRIADVPADDLAMICDLDLDLDGALRKKSRSPFVRIASKQMVGIFLTIWVRRGLRKCVQNLKVSTVGVGAMGYIGNKVGIWLQVSLINFFSAMLQSFAVSGRAVELTLQCLDVCREQCQ